MAPSNYRAEGETGQVFCFVCGSDYAALARAVRTIGPLAKLERTNGGRCTDVTDCTRRITRLRTR